MPLAAFKQAYILSSLCTDGKALLLGFFLYKAIEELRFSVVEISQYICSVSQGSRYLNNGECHIQTNKLQRFYCRFQLTARKDPEVIWKTELHSGNFLHDTSCGISKNASVEKCHWHR